MKRTWQHGCAHVLLTLAVCMLATSIAYAQQVQVVNMIPNFWSNEINWDSEPNLAVNPANPTVIVGSALTPSNGFCSANLAPIFVSMDGGSSWNLSCIIPSNPAGTGTGDITVRFAGTSNNLYAGILRAPSGCNFRLNILRTNNLTTPMTWLVDRCDVDQPYIQAAMVLGGVGNDRVYVGNNNLCAPGPCKTATVDLSLDAASASPPAGFSPILVEARGTCRQDGPSIRPAIHVSGTIYAAFFRWTACSTPPYIADVVVVRDNNWGAGATPFTALRDPSDGKPGRLVATGVSIPWTASLGTQRIGMQLTIAVDPSDSQTVYLAWADGASASSYTIHVRRSTDGGKTWTGDQRSITGATNPGLAINTLGKVGFLYQKLTGSVASQRWETHLELTSNGFGTNPTDLILANVPDSNGTYTGPNPIGDYADIIADGRNFYGTFSANNTPNMANFPNGVSYQRNANFDTHTLLGLNGVTPVGVSIDPFFFKVVEPAGHPAGLAPE